MILSANIKREYASGDYISGLKREQTSVQCWSSNCGTTAPAAIRSADIKRENTSGDSICGFKREPTAVQTAVAASKAAASTTAGAVNTRTPRENC